MNPRKMEQMMKQMGIDVTDIDAEEVVIRTADEELVFDGAEVTRMDAQGQQTYQVVGDPESRPRGEGGASAEAGADDASAESGADDASAESDADAEAVESADEIPDDDVELVATRAGVSRDEAREALEAEDGDLAAAISRLE
ncbi:nascent polypeptide-associated complex protein [Candidatus Halobonum tyrrellensis G22]|uniref:Nascent polypeptide-associated complex protein n=2 Tax=Candidatus Halobonum TaxID=1431544 RepID=V4IY28_9EURY|nr:nascent polypeptide-associated complex protein [Candidatus Halobonum tyrrellensis G22]